MYFFDSTMRKVSIEDSLPISNLIMFVFLPRVFGFSDLCVFQDHCFGFRAIPYQNQSMQCVANIFPTFIGKSEEQSNQKLEWVV